MSATREMSSGMRTPARRAAGRTPVAIAKVEAKIAVATAMLAEDFLGGDGPGRWIEPHPIQVRVVWIPSALAPAPMGAGSPADRGVDGSRSER